MNQPIPAIHSEPLQVRPAVNSDAETIARFNAAMARETEGLELDPARLLEGVRALLRDPAKGFYLMGCAAGAAVGQLMITYEWSDWRNGNFWWIQSVYVRPEDRGRGVFAKLYRAAEERARASGDACGLRLYVEEENARAQRVYAGLGMKPTSYRMYEIDFILKR
jgi:ribosomal protein S18 acetylase RimI-like enzyme